MTMRPMLRQTTCTVADPWPSLPRLLRCGLERRDSPSYERIGRFNLGMRYGVFQFTLSGCGEVEDASGRHAVPPGHAFVLRLPDPTVAWRLPPDAREPWTFVWMDFIGGGSEALVDELVARHGHVHALPPAHPDLLRLRRLADTPGCTIPIAATAGAALVNGLLLGLAAQQAVTVVSERSAALARRALEAIRSGATVPADVNALALILAVSREHLSRACRRHLGRTPHACLTEERLLRACRLLTTTTQANGAIAAAVGLSSAGQFVRIFRRALGITPQRYRDWPEGHAT